MAQEPPATQANVANRAMAVAKYALEVDKVSGGWLVSVEDVATEKLGPDNKLHIYIAGVTLKCGAGLEKGLYSWLAATISRKPERHDGAVYITDKYNRIASTLKFHRGLIAE